MAKTGLIASDVPQGRLIERPEVLTTDDTASNGS